MVSSFFYAKLNGIVVLLQVNAWYRHIVTVNWMVLSCCYRKLHGIVILLRETEWYRHIVAGNCKESSCCRLIVRYRKDLGRCTGSIE